MEPHFSFWALLRRREVGGREVQVVKLRGVGRVPREKKRQGWQQGRGKEEGLKLGLED